uniref:DEAD/DEAH box helicase n=1 Tax=Roseihalotalea indica TaxID=2867963 RepID=A0AA49JFQ6_9BACT|nr:DEAD/DEAH box helicase [Tunicatimonas sp. TK19036]
MTFKEFKLHKDLLSGLGAMGFEEPTPIQEQTIPPILEGRDIIGCAQTGTGKTAAYLLPTIHHILQHKPKGIQALVIAPTRELAGQIDQQLEGFSYFTPISSITVYGGKDASSFDKQKVALKEGTEIVIATPGKLLTHLNLGYVNLEHLKFLILDEADRMLDMGFYEDIMRIAHYVPKVRQTLLFSATMPPKIRQLAKNLLNDPYEVNIALSKPADRIIQAAFSVHGRQKLPLLEHLLKAKQVNSLIVFCARKTTVKEISKIIEKLDYEVAAIHSDLEQSEREDILRKFKNKQLHILVATDILSRGIDVDGIELVINYDVPHDAEDYVHRIGRTARADAKGAAFTFITPDEQNAFGRIEKLIETTITKAKVPAYMGEAPAYEPNKKRNSGGMKRQRFKGRRKKS